MDEITAAQAAILTGVSERTIRRKIASGVIPARRIGRNRFAIKVADLQMARPFQALTLRMDELERRVHLLELRLQTVVPAAESQQDHRQLGNEEAIAPPSATLAELPTLPASGEIQRLLAQLAYETARLARILPAQPSSQDSSQDSSQGADSSATAAAQNDKTPADQSGRSDNAARGEAM